MRLRLCINAFAMFLLMHTLVMHTSAPVDLHATSTEMHHDMLMTASVPPVPTVVSVELTPTWQQQAQAAVQHEQTWRKPIKPEGITIKPEDQRGNWYDKRQILSQAREMYEQLRGIIARVEAQEPLFLQRQKQVSKQIEDLYLAVGFEQGTVGQLFNTLIDELAQERTTQGQLSEGERTLLADIEEKKKMLQELRDYLVTLHELEGTIDKAIVTMFEQIELCRSYEQKAWENYEKIDNVLNEKIAQQLYLEIQSFVEHATNIDTYLRTRLLPYIDQSAQSLRGYTEKITTSVDELQAKGVILSKKLKEEEKAAEEARRQQEELRKKQQEKQQQPLPLPTTWWEKMSNVIQHWWQQIKELFTPSKGAVIVPIRSTHTESKMTTT
jgi:hypothetical protein